ncbi:MAG: FtsQ-type POTRA domain-containing protein [Oscillospiraceae bacterium]|jgi:cell division protein FtsQ|nr:FtsQ-type POTRA domain-containing protein [Oscillospiraceae bacterium]
MVIIIEKGGMRIMADRRGVRRRGRSAAVYTPVALLLIVFVSAFGVSVFFRVTAIIVSGASRYTPEEIIGKSGLAVGDNLIFVDGSTAARRLGQLPYVSEVRITRRLPDTVEVIITEAVPFAVIRADGKDWLIDMSGRVLEQTDERGRAEYIMVRGIAPISPEPGSVVEVAPESGTRLYYMTELLRAISDKGIQGDIDDIDMSNISGITFLYKGVTVEMGSGEEAAYKIEKMIGAEAEARRSGGAVGKIDVSKDGHTNVWENVK